MVASRRLTSFIQHQREHVRERMGLVVVVTEISVCSVNISKGVRALGLEEQTVKI